MFFSGWYGLWHVVAASVVGYAAVVAVLRVSGKRTLTKMNAFDLVVTVALGSTLARMIQAKDVALSEGMLAFVMLALLQFVVSWTSVHFPRSEVLVKSEPTLIYYRGSYLWEAMRTVRLTESEVLATLRKQGIGSMDVDAVVLETDGSLSVVPREGEAENSTLANLKRWQGGEKESRRGR